MQPTPDDRPLTPDEIDGSFVPHAVSDLDRVWIGDELVLRDGWHTATTLNPSGALIWDRIDGANSLDQIAADLSEATGASVEVIRPDVVALARQLAMGGLFANAAPPPEDLPQAHLEPIPALDVGDQVNDPGFTDLADAPQALSDHLGPESLIVNWSPHCGYCWAIAEHLAVLTKPLADAGVNLVLVTATEADANRQVAGAVGLDAPILVRGDGPDPFVGYGTPAAYHVDATGRLVAPMVIGSDAVLRMAGELAGVDPVGLLTDDDAEPIPAGTKYLLTEDGVCGPTTGEEVTSTWSGTSAYRIDGYHVGLRHDSEETAEILDALFGGHRVNDRRASHSYSVTLNLRAPLADVDAPANPARSPQVLNLLVRGGQQLVRSRSAARVVRALLQRLTDDIVGFETDPGHLRVQATAAVRVADGRALLLPAGIAALTHSIGPRLARLGIALADMPFPEIDLTTAELVIPEPAITHDPQVIARLDQPIASASELDPVRPGRYPLGGWAVAQPGAAPVHPLSPAEAAAATLSHVYEADSPAARLQELGELFTKIEGFGIWYDSEAQLVAAIAQVLARSAGPSSS